MSSTYLVSFTQATGCTAGCLWLVIARIELRYRCAQCFHYAVVVTMHLHLHLGSRAARNVQYECVRVVGEQAFEQLGRQKQIWHSRI